jgi:hypothetical protein
MSATEKRYLSADKRASTAARALALVYVVSALVLLSYGSDIKNLRYSVVPYAALWVSCVAMWIAAGYFVGLVIQSAGSGCFPKPSARVPVRQRIWTNTMAHFARVMTIVGAISLVMLSAIFIFAVLRV